MPNTLPIWSSSSIIRLRPIYHSPASTQRYLYSLKGVDPGGRVGPGPQYFAKGAMHQCGLLQHVLPCQSVIKIMKCFYCLNCLKFGQLIIRKTLESLPLDVRFFGQNVQNSISVGASPHITFEELTALLRWCSFTALPLTPGCT